MTTVLDWLMNKVLEHDNLFKEMGARMGLIKDYADQINAFSSQAAQDVERLAAIVIEVQSRLGDVSAELASELAPAVEGFRTVSENLHALANPNRPEDNPVPTPGDDGDSELPVEDSENPV
jgi:hypothetical protein